MSVGKSEKVCVCVSVHTLNIMQAYATQCLMEHTFSVQRAAFKYGLLSELNTDLYLDLI